jgi:hypothetical protein
MPAPDADAADDDAAAASAAWSLLQAACHVMLDVSCLTIVADYLLHAA